ACSRNDPNLNDCALKSAIESLHQFSLGDRQRGLDPLDPILITEITVFVPNENGLKLVFKKNNKLISVDALVNLDVKNIYELSGKILMLPIKSNGDASIKLKNTTLHVKFWYDHVEGNDGKIHWKIRKRDIKYEVGRAYFRLENLLVMERDNGRRWSTHLQIPLQCCCGESHCIS
ncbi:Takeout-like protein 4, partial [Operophtera brumata]